MPEGEPDQYSTTEEGHGYDVSLEEVRQVMPGGSYYVESIGTTNTPPTPDRPVAWSVYVDPVEQRYEVAGWAGGRIKERYIVTLHEAGHFGCSCRQGQRGFKDSARGYCQHVNRLTLHAARRERTLEAPAHQIEQRVQELPIWRSSSKATIVTAAADMDGSNASPLIPIRFIAPIASPRSQPS
jgi:hypothetical protein